MSRPTRARGLKHARFVEGPQTRNVAPHAGAWIETVIPATATGASPPSRPTRARGLKHTVAWLYRWSSATSRPTRARGLKLVYRGAVLPKVRVAPHAGAWIETRRAQRKQSLVAQSRPTRARGLKPRRTSSSERSCGVAPHAGAWIETWRNAVLKVIPSASRPTRARGLKHA